MNTFNISIRVITVAALLPFINVSAANLASDSAADGAYDDGWQTGDNGGSGFGAWTIFTTDVNPDRNGVFVGSSGNNGSAPSGNIDSAGRAWGTYANQLINQDVFSIGFVSASRSFTGGELSIGQSLLIRMDNGFIGSTFRGAGAVGFSLNRFSFFFAGGGSEYRIGYGDPNDTIGLQGTGVAFTDDGLDLAFTRTGVDTYQFVITPNGGAAVEINGVMSETGGALDSILLYNKTAGAGAEADAFFNSMAIIPEPATAVLVGLGLLSAATLRRRS